MALHFNHFLWSYCIGKKSENTQEEHEKVNKGHEYKVSGHFLNIWQ